MWKILTILIKCDKFIKTKMGDKIPLRGLLAMVFETEILLKIINYILQEIYFWAIEVEKKS